MALSEKEIRELNNVERWQIEEIKKGLEAADRGEFASDEEVEQVLKRWRRGHPTGNALFRRGKNDESSLKTL
jgi:predicted transcriptional regulator